MSKALAQELRENCAYLQEGGWQNSAILMRLAANEIDRLEERIKELEAGRAEGKTAQPKASRDVVSRLGLWGKRGPSRWGI